MREIDREPQSPWARPWMLRGLVIALAAVVGVIVWMATSDGEEGPAPAGSTPAPAEARLLSEEELAEAAAAAGHPATGRGRSMTPSWRSPRSPTADLLRP